MSRRIVYTSLRAVGVLARASPISVTDRLNTPIFSNGEIAFTILALATARYDSAPGQRSGDPRPNFLWGSVIVDGREASWLRMIEPPLASGFPYENGFYSRATTLRGVAPALGEYRVGVSVAFSATASAGVVLRPPTALSAELRITVIQGDLPPKPGVRLSWFQARYLAERGVKIRREGWQDHYLYRTTGLWWMQLYNPTTKADTTHAPVVAAQWTEADFRANDWIVHGSVEPELLAEALQIFTLFPR